MKSNLKIVKYASKIYKMLKYAIISTENFLLKCYETYFIIAQHQMPLTTKNIQVLCPNKSIKILIWLVEEKKCVDIDQISICKW